MNILFRDGCTNEHVQLVNMIREKINPKLSIVCSTEVLMEKLKITGNELFLDYYKTLEGKYDDSLLIPPIEEETLLRLSPYYSEILRVIGRNGAFYYSYPKREELFLRIVRYWDWALDYHEIDLCLGFSVPHFSHDIIIYHLCKIKKIKTLDTWHTGVPSYMHFIEDIDDIGKEIIIPYNDYLNKFIDADISTIPLNEDYQKNYDLHTSLSGDRTPFYMKESRLDIINRRIRRLTGYYRYLRANKKNPFKGLLMKKYKNLDGGNYMRKYRQNISKVDYAQKEKYIYVPLHMQPEASTCPLGGVYANQLLMINMLSYHLPPGCCLYVKENPKQDNSERSIVFLEEILKLDNVKIVSVKENTYDLIENCTAVATITGTVAWEALFREKPTIIFGKHINRYAPGVFMVRDNNDCQKIMDIIFNVEVDAKSDELFLKKVKIFMRALNDVSFKSIVLSETPASGEKTLEDIKLSCDIICNKIIGMFKKDGQKNR